MFGSFSSGGFGSTPSFGQPATTTGGFGAQPTTGFGAQPTSTFGSTPAFGQPTTTPAFGQPTSTFGAPSTPSTGFGGFGATPSTFGAPSTPSTGFGSTPGFGQPASTSTGFGGFGATSTAPAFGASTSSTFGAPSTPSMFGAPSTTGGMFGASSTPSMFGASTTTAPTASPFGSTQPSTFGTGFGATPSSFGASVGTGNPPYKTSPDSDTGNNGQPLQHTAITAMPAYQNKSFEELRFEDYTSKKGSLGTTATPGFGATTPSAFGASTTTPSPFGSTAPTFGATPSTPSSTGFGFGSTTSTTTPAPSTGGFGFGATTTPAPSTGGFGFGSTTAPSSTASPFGASTTAPSTGGFGFGSTTSTTSPFGAPSTAAPSPFGASTTTAPSSTGFGFGASTTTPSPFGATTAARPGTTPTTTGFGFGATPAPATAPGTGGFGFGTTPSATTPSLFGPSTTTPASTGFGFGTTPSATTAPTTSLFGATTPSATTTTAPSTGGFGGFGFGTTPSATTTAPTAAPSLFGGFGSTTAPATSATTPSFSFTPASPAPASGGFGFGTAPAPTLGTSGKTTSISSPSPFGTVPPPISPAVAAPPQPSIVPVTPTARKPPMTPSHYKVTPKSAAKIKPRGYSSTSKQVKPLFEEAPASTPDFFVTRTSIKKLNIEPEEESEMPPKTPGGSFLLTPSRADVTMTSPQATPLAPRTGLDSTPLTASLLKPVATKGPVQFKTLTSIKTHTEDLNELPSLTREGYYTIPDLKTLSQYTTDQLSNVEDFVIGLKDVGSVQFLDPVDVRGLDLDKIIEFSIGEIVVYPDEHNKPVEGQGLNKPARVTLEHLWPMDRASNRRKLDEDSLTRYEHKIKKSTERLGARFLSYERKTGNWTFEVEHFSRYGLLEDDSEDEDEVMQQPQQPVPPSPGRFKLEIANSEDSEEPTEDEEEEEEEEMEDEITSDIIEEMPITGNEVVPRLPEQLGLDPNRMQVMKSFLFDDTLTSKRKSIELERRATPKKDLQLVPERPLPLQPLYPELPPKPISTAIQYVPYASSISYGSQRSQTDQSFSMGRSFRVGWGPNGTFIHSTRAMGRVTMKKVFVVPVEEDVAQQYAPLLEEHYECSAFIGNSPTGVPTFALQDVYQNIKNNILQLEEQEKNTRALSDSNRGTEHSKLVFQLVSALWGQDTSANEVFTGFEIKSDETYAETIARRLALNYWLKNTVQPSVSREIVHSKNSLDSIFSLMSGKQISEAAIKAIEQKDYRLATLLAQACSNGSLRSDLKLQLETWTNNGIVDKIDGKRWKLYRLLSGDVNGVSSDLDWKRAFAMQYWYSTPNNAPISQIIENYDRSVTKNCCRPPVPSYIEALSNELPSQVNFTENASTIAITETGDSYTWNDRKEYFKLNANGQWVKSDISEIKNIISVSPIGLDTNYHLLKLRADQTYDLWRVVSPNSSSPFALDYRLSWHLLSALTTLGYQTIDEYHKLFMSYVFQLENAGLWYWSIYVLLHLPQHEDELKESAIRALLARHAHEMHQLTEEFLLDKLHIPSEWIDEAKSYYSPYNKETHSEIFYVLRSKQWNRAHELILNVLAPELILKGKLDDLYELLVPLRENYKKVVDWELGGNIYYDYITITRDVKNCITMAADPSTVEAVINRVPELESLVTSLSKRLSSFIVKRERDNLKAKRLSERVCLTDMAAQLAVYLKELKKFMATLKQEEEDKEIVQLTPALTSMDVPEDYKLLHLRDLQKSYLRVKVRMN